MRIACCSHYFTPEIGAPSARIGDFAKEWLASGHEVHVVTCLPNHPVGRLYPGYSRRLYLHEELGGIHVHRHWTYMTPNRGFFRKNMGHISYLPGAMLWSLRQVPRPDVVIGSSPTFFAAEAAWALARRHRVPFVMEVRDLWPAAIVELGVTRRRALVRLLEKWEMSLYRRADQIVTVTESFREDLIRRGVPDRKTAVVLSGASTNYWQPCDPPPGMRARLGLEGKFVALYAGAHGISQALDTLLEAARLLKRDTDVFFVFVGEGAEKWRLAEKARAMALKNVLFRDPVDRDGVRDYYALADACLVSLRNIRIFDSFIPSKMFEMLAMGKPLVACVRGEAARILADSGGALVVEPEDAAGVAAALRRLRGDPREAEAMGRSGREHVAGRYARRGLAERYLAVLEDALRRPREGSP